jgi:hypothetical protein
MGDVDDDEGMTFEEQEEARLLAAENASMNCFPMLVITIPRWLL